MDVAFSPLPRPTEKRVSAVASAVMAMLDPYTPNSLPSVATSRYRRSTIQQTGVFSLGFRYQRRLSLGRNGRLNVGKRGASVSRRVGRVTLNSRGGGSIRVLPGLSFRFGKRR